MRNQSNKSILGIWYFGIFFVLMLGMPVFVVADVVGDQQHFFVDALYDEFERKELDATLRVANNTAYLYVENTWWNGLSAQDQHSSQQFLIAFANEFEQIMYPTLTGTFGSEWKPGIDNSAIITILLHTMKKDAGGYTNYGDEYQKVQNPKSNQREMMYLNALGLGSPLLKAYLAHEFVHLITFYQKSIVHKIEEEVWLNEVRAEYAPTLLGYDTVLEDANIKRRIRDFLRDPLNSLVEWQNIPADYGLSNLFAQYLVDHYGVEVLVHSMQSPKVGKASLDEALAKSKFAENFSQVFMNWVITLLLNDCTYGPRYCYYNPHLVNFRVVPQTNFLPNSGDSTLTFDSTTKDWAGNWIKIVGGKSMLKVEFSGEPLIPFEVVYALEDAERRFSLYSLPLSGENKGTLAIDDFNGRTRALMLLPVAKGAGNNIEGEYPVRSFSFAVSSGESKAREDEAMIKKLMEQIAFLKAEIARLQTVVAAYQKPKISCAALSQNLVFGMKNNAQVQCLQEFLVLQGKDVYPEGFITGTFGSFTRAAVMKFQQKYHISNTGTVGPITRAKINPLLR